MSERVRTFLEKAGLAGPARWLRALPAAAGGTLLAAAGSMSGGRFFSRALWRRRERRIGYDDPGAFWREWGRFYIHDSSRNRPGEEHAILLERIRRWRPRSILEVGCGFGLNLGLILGEHRPEILAGIDFSPTMLEKARGYLAGKGLLDRTLLLRADVTDGIPAAAGSFDLVFTHGLMMHIKPDSVGTAFDELLRVSSRYVMNMEVVVPRADHPRWIERDIGRYSYDYRREYSERGADILLDEMKGGHRVVAVQVRRTA